MFGWISAKVLLALWLLVLCLAAPASSQDPLGLDVYKTPSDLKRSSSLDDGEPLPADPLSIGPLMRPLDIEHTWEYLSKVRGQYQEGPFRQDLQGRWNLDLSEPASLDLMLLQNREAVFGRGVLTSSGVSQAAYATGGVYRDVLYLDVISEGLVLYRCTLTIGKGQLSGGYYAFEPGGRVWTGRISCRAVITG